MFFGKSKTEFFISSELKVIDEIEWFKEVPMGVTRINSSDFSIIKNDNVINAMNDEVNLFDLMQEAVVKRIPRNGMPFGVFLSGGLDSSIVAALASKENHNVHYFSLANTTSSDFPAINAVVDYLKLKEVHSLSLPKNLELENLIERVVYITESFNPSIISNGLATYLLSKEARKFGIKVVLTGEGADELFGGYKYCDSEEEWRAFRSILLRDMHFTELRRLDLCTMANSVEARCPFLDKRIIRYAEQLKYEELFFNGVNKKILRNTFKNLLPEAIVDRKKISCDVGSGIRELVVTHLKKKGRAERDVLKKIWSKFKFGNQDHPYFSKYPAFDDVIDKRGICQR